MSKYVRALTAALRARMATESSYGGSAATWAGINSPDGLSDWGTPSAPHLPNYLSNNPLPHGRPWGTRTSQNTNYYDDCPNTGVTRKYDWTIDKVPCAPDGVNNTCLLINNQFPGPLVEANWGDWIEVTVTNNIPNEGTSLHWHGLLQKKTPFMDGVPGFTQCPIAPGSTFTYRFQADLYGTSWYHSHWSAQYGSGLFGPMVIYGPVNQTYDVDLGPVMVSDYYHAYYYHVVQGLMQPASNITIPKSDNNLINGRNSFDCATTNLTCTPNAPMASFNFTAGKTYRLRLINPSSAAVQKISIDGHKFTVIANDFVEVQPYVTDVITLSVGQRSDVLVKATGQPGDSYWMRGYKPTTCWPSHGGDEVTAAIFYDNADVNVAPTSSPGPNAYSQDCANDPLTQTTPLYPMDPGDASVSEVIPLVFNKNASDHLLWYMANRTFRVDYNDPTLLDVKLGQLDFPEIRNTHNYGTNRSVRLIFENAGQQPHPMHIHGHNMFILAEGACNTGPSTTSLGSTNSRRDVGFTDGGGVDSGVRVKRASDLGSCWDGHITNAKNPQRRDVQMLPAGQYLVVQWNQDNPGVWPMHCHIAWHLSEGMVWTVIEQPGAVATDMDIPSIMAQTCRDWANWSGDHVVEQIDDGL